MASLLGEEYDTHRDIIKYVRDEFYHCLKAVEAFYRSIEQYKRPKLEEIIYYILDLSELDLGIAWKNEQFIKIWLK